jgi:IS5 family transposase
LHLLTTLDGLVTDFVITPANVDDRAVIWELVDTYSNITMLGDKGYTKAELSADLKSEKRIDLLPVQKSNSKVQFPKSVRRLIFKLGDVLKQRHRSLLSR